MLIKNYSIKNFINPFCLQSEPAFAGSLDKVHLRLFKLFLEFLH